MKQIPLTQGKFALVDDDDYELVNKHTWHCVKFMKRYYAQSWGMRDGKMISIYLHRLILGAKLGEQIDHKDRDGLNNQRANLRFCNNGENQCNRDPWGVSKYMGVCWDKSRKKWKAQIRKYHKMIHQKRFDNEIDAALQYNIWAKDIHKEFANLNVV